MNFARLKKNLTKDVSSLKTLKVALLGDSATQLLSQALRGYGYEAGLHIDLYEAEYNQIDANLLDVTSALYQFAPRYILLFQSTQHLRRRFYDLPLSERSHFAKQVLDHVMTTCQTVASRQGDTQLIYFNFCEMDDRVFGHYANKVDSSFLWQLRQINYGLMTHAHDIKNLHIFDLCALQSRYGQSFLFDSRFYVNADMVLGTDALPLVARHLIDMIQAAEGRVKKCLILDLDNTLWGGVIGDDGMAGIQIGDLGIGKAFTELQLWIKQLKMRGILLAACSKNSPETALEPFQDHPDMVLRPDDFSVFVANWNNKVDNVRHIQKVLNIGLDSMVFLDDNPVERSLIREHVPGICVPELPEDPVDFLSCLQDLNLFETVSFTEEDIQRTQQYRQEAQRTSYQSTFANETEFLASLDMVAQAGSFEENAIPRIAQLTQRSNQFNLRTVRYSEAQLQTISASDQHLTFAFTLRDKFGDNGLISVVILKKQDTTLFIDTWLMSCRVFKRGMERFVLNDLVSAAQKGGFTQLLGEYIPTAKNQMVKDHYQTLGFQQQNTLWVLDVKSYHPTQTTIQKAAEPLLR